MQPGWKLVTIMGALGRIPVVFQQIMSPESRQRLRNELDELEDESSHDGMPSPSQSTEEKSDNACP